MRIGISTGGGDCPGLNAVIRAVVRAAERFSECEVVGIHDGLEGLIRGDGLTTLTLASVSDILARGGTILGTTNRGNPFRYAVRTEAGVVERDVSDRVIANARAAGLDVVIFVGGDGTQDIAARLAAKGLRVIGVPKTIDNDLLATDVTFGFDTAVGVATEALDRLRTTAESHDRTMLLEVMGRHAGWIAVQAGLAGGADVIVIPEIPYNIAAIHACLEARRLAGHHFHLIVVSEGAMPGGGSVSLVAEQTAGKVARLGGAAERLLNSLMQFGEYEARVTVLGHLQRGGTPTPCDRVLGTRFGVRAVELARAGASGRMVCLHGTHVTDVPIEDAVGRQRTVDPEGELVRTARAIGVCMGD
ncbi:MAG: 6-phosphofructokinase [Myxococcales bacterium]|nr:6-phosphofructokinase [Myxococcales bacterium]